MVYSQDKGCYQKYSILESIFKKMKILLINKYHYRKGGAERAYFDMADILTKGGHEVAFFSMKHVQNEPTVWSKYFVSEVDYSDKKLSLGRKIHSALRIIWNHEANVKLAALINDFQPDVAHAHNIYHQLSPSIFHILKKKKVPIVLTLHDYKLVSPNYSLYANSALWDHSSGLRCIKDRCVQGSYLKSTTCAIEKWMHGFWGSYALVDVFISPSRFLALKVKELGWKGRDIVVLPNPLRNDELTATNVNVIVPDRILFFGRLSPEKGIDQLVRAMQNVPKKQLVILGDGPAKEFLQQLVTELNLKERISFLPAQYGDALTREIQTAEAVVIPSLWYENLPYVVTESLSLGAVVVAAASGGIQERIIHGVNGFLYPLNDEKSLVKILQSLETANLQLVRENAQKSVQDLTPERFRASLENIYKTLV